MHKFERRAKNTFNFGWEHGIYGDYWSFVHILTGVLFGIGAAYFQFPYWGAFWVVFGLLALYEAWELVADIVEDFENAFTDILIGQIGFVLAFKYIDNHGSDIFALLLFFEVGVIALFLLSIGYRKFLKRRMKEVKQKRRAKRR